MLKTIAIIIVVLWLLGFGFRIAGDVIHILLVVGIVIFILDLVGIGKKTGA